MCSAAHMNSRGMPGHLHKRDIKVARTLPNMNARTAHNSRGWSRASKPIDNVVRQRTENADRERTPDDPQQQHGTRALGQISYRGDETRWVAWSSKFLLCY